MPLLSLRLSALARRQTASLVDSSLLCPTPLLQCSHQQTPSAGQCTILMSYFLSALLPVSCRRLHRKCNPTRCLRCPRPQSPRRLLSPHCHHAVVLTLAKSARCPGPAHTRRDEEGRQRSKSEHQSRHPLSQILAAPGRALRTPQPCSIAAEQVKTRTLSCIECAWQHQAGDRYM